MELKYLRAIEKLNLVVGALLVAGSLLFRRGDVILGTALGAGLSALNFHAIRRVVAAVLASRSPRKQGLLMATLLVKMAVLIALVWVVIRYAPVSVLAFIVGLSTFLVSVLLLGLRAGAAAEEPAEEARSAER